MLTDAEAYVYKKEVDWSLLLEGLTLPVDNQVIFLQSMDHFLQRGESKAIHFFLNGKTYDAKIVNMNNPADKRKRDAYQIRYTPNGDLSQALQASFARSYAYLLKMRELREKGDRRMIKLPESDKEYLAVYTTEYPDTFVLEPIVAEDVATLHVEVKHQKERIWEAEFNYDTIDETAGISTKSRLVRIRKLNKKIGDNLKLLYGYRCQICGRLVGEEYGSHIAEAHHIDYFVHSLNNDANNQMIVCPNHHSIIHDANPVFNRRYMMFEYENGYQEKLTLNLHLK